MNIPKRFFVANRKWALPACYTVYLAVLALAIRNHELWSDELHSWNLAKASRSYPDLIANSRYEGHPPLWYTILWLLTRSGGHLAYLQAAQFCIAGAAGYMLMFRSDLPAAVKVLAPFGYYFLFEYGVLSRNYAIGLLFAFMICRRLSRQEGSLPLPYYLLLILLSNTHMLGALAACSLHLYFLMQRQERKQPATTLLMHAFLGILAISPALYFIMPPSDSGMTLGFWLSRWNSEQLRIIAEAPVKALLPVPAWWNFHFWNSHFLLEPGSFLQPGGLALCAVSGALLILTCSIFRHNRKCLYLFLCNFLLTAAVAFIFPLTSARYVGFIYICFVLAVWLMYAEGGVAARKARLILIFAIAQIPGGLYAVTRDIRGPFSNSEKAAELIEAVPTGKRIVSTYSCIQNLVAVTGRPAYCLELNREVSYMLWDKRLADMRKSSTPYTDGMNRLLRHERLDQVYLISNQSWQELQQRDTAFTKTYQVEAAGRRSGAIEKHSNLYLYRISLPAPNATAP